MLETSYSITSWPWKIMLSNPSNIPAFVLATAVVEGLLLLLQRLLAAGTTMCTLCLACGHDNSCALLCFLHQATQVVIGISCAALNPQHGQCSHDDDIAHLSPWQPLCAASWVVAQAVPQCAGAQLQPPPSPTRQQKQPAEASHSWQTAQDKGAMHTRMGLIFVITLAVPVASESGSAAATHLASLEPCRNIPLACTPTCALLKFQIW